jgi:hypothetical protein
LVRRAALSDRHFIDKPKKFTVARAGWKLFRHTVASIYTSAAFGAKLGMNFAVFCLGLAFLPSL